MSWDRSATGSSEVPSVIAEMVIYDKPNKPLLPKEILPQCSGIDIDQGDIVLICKKEDVQPTTSKVELEEIDEEDEEEAEEEEGDGEQILIVNDNIVAEENVQKEENISFSIDSVNAILNDYLDDTSSEVEESIENISREVQKLNSETPIKQQESTMELTELVVQPKKEELEKMVANVPNEPLFKKPLTTPQKNTILNFIIKAPKINFLLDEGEKSEEEGQSPARQKRTRRMPKKFDNSHILVDEAVLGYHSDQEAPTPKRKKVYASLAPVVSEEEDSEALDEASGTESEDSVNSLVITPQGRKLRRNADLTKRKIKAEIDIDNDGVVEGQEELESDEDSRKEWVPEEYAEYKLQHKISKISTNKMHKCKFCDLEFGSYYSMRKHRAIEHDDVGKDRKDSTYDRDDDDVEGSQALNDSDEESRGEWMPEDYAEYKLKHTLIKQKRVQWYKCKICCAMFSNYYKLSKHRLEHENKSDPYECKSCDAKFKDVDTLTAHLRTHQGKDPYQCKKCEKGFQTKDELTEHEPVHVLKKVPEAEKKFRCDVCGKEFRKLCDIDRHTRVHTGEKPAECNICHKRFQQTHNLSKHLLTHLHVRPFQCEICNKKFGRVDVLNRHLLTHSMEKPFKCGLCNKGFIRQVQLNNHMEKIHPDALEDINNVNVTDEVSVTLLG